MGVPGNWRWHGMYERYPDHQLCLVDGGGKLVAAANGLPVRWEGTASSLPSGSDEVLVRAVDDGPPERPDAVCMLSVSVDPAHRAVGHAERLLTEVRTRAADRCPRGVIIPVRPTRKPRYPLVPIEAYATWRRPDGRCFDPWLRTHLELGARQLGIAHRSLVIRQPVSRWEEFLGLRTFARAGDTRLPTKALVPLRVGDDGHGTYAEPNVWVHHPAGAP
ncbi:hypothetical protein [Streptomyces sp. DHE17-7]|uniref:hypothetical protein n=1 Tax=Streptomyces sp. DHE17-7 TaxID=2759949 RepID=UPI0022EB015A|nr:hypothetical protein [Streptomyces sp. DHE17-7]